MMSHKMDDVKEKVYNVCLLGCSLDTGNRGVSALAASLAKIILSICHNARIFLLIGNKSSKPQELSILGKKIMLNVVNYRLSLRARIKEHLFFIFLMACLYKLLPFQSTKKGIIKSNNWLKTLKEADFVGDIHGGDSFSDIYGLKRFIISSIPLAIILLLNKKLIFLPQTYGPFKSKISRIIAHFIMSRAAYILSRDRESITLVKELLVNENNNQTIKFCPDVAFVLDSKRPDILDIVPQIDASSDINLTGLNISGLLYNGGYTKDNMFRLKLDYKCFIYKLIECFLFETKANLILIPHTFGVPGNINSDPDACRDIFNTINRRYDGRIYMVNREYDQYEIKGIIGLCDFFIGSRMHACIAALSQRVPTIGVAYSKKFSGVFESIGLGDMVIDARFINVDQAINKILEFFKMKKEFQLLIKEKTMESNNKINETFRELLVR